MSVLLIIVVLSVHLLAVNLASAGPLVSLWLGWRPGGGDPLRNRVGQTVAWHSVGAMILGMLTGGGLLVFPPSAGLSAAVGRLPNRALWFAGSELLFSLVCVLICAVCWPTLRRHRWWHALLALLASSNLLYHFPPLMSVLGKLAANPSWARADLLDRSTLLPLMARSEILALSIHFVLASIAVSAIAALWHLSRSSEADWTASGLPLARSAAGIALLASVLQVPIGLWLLLSLPQSGRMAMIGNNVVASVAFVGALLLTFILIQRLLTIVIGSPQRRELRLVAWLVAVLVLLMTASLHGTRTTTPFPAAPKRAQKQPQSTTSLDAGASRLLGLANGPLRLNETTSRWWLPMLLAADYSAFGSFLTSSKDPPGSLPALISSA